jgi:hypothetical protein
MSMPIDAKIRVMNDLICAMISCGLLQPRHTCIWFSIVELLLAVIVVVVVVLVFTGNKIGWTTMATKKANGTDSIRIRVPIFRFREWVWVQETYNKTAF